MQSPANTPDATAAQKRWLSPEADVPAKRLRPLSPPRSTLPTPSPYDVETRTASRTADRTAAWIAETTGMAAPPGPEVVPLSQAAAWIAGATGVSMPSEPDAAEAASEAGTSLSLTTRTIMYRGLMTKAGIVPESWDRLPPTIEALVDVVLSTTAVPDAAGELSRAGSRFCVRSRELTSDCANDTAWRVATAGMLDGLCFASGADTMIKMSFEQHWCEEVLPQVPTQQSPRTAKQPPVLQLKRPRPNLQLSLTDYALNGGTYTSMLEQLSDLGSLISNPSKPNGHGRFPFLVCQLKSAAAGGTLFGAQNQTSVAAAAAQRIFYDLQKLYRGGILPRFPTFALCAEGSFFQLYVYYYTWDTHKFVGKRVRHWDSTSEGDAIDLARCVSRILDWAASDFKKEIVRALDGVARQAGVNDSVT